MKIKLVLATLLMIFSHLPKIIASTDDNLLMSSEIFSDSIAWTNYCNKIENLVQEDFSNTNIGPNTISVCSHTISGITDDQCFQMDSLESGFEISVSDIQGEIVLLTPNEFFNFTT